MMTESLLRRDSAYAFPLPIIQKKKIEKRYKKNNSEFSGQFCFGWDCDFARFGYRREILYG